MNNFQLFQFQTFNKLNTPYIFWLKKVDRLNPTNFVQRTMLQIISTTFTLQYMCRLNLGFNSDTRLILHKSDLIRFLDQHFMLWKAFQHVRYRLFQLHIVHKSINFVNSYINSIFIVNGIQFIGLRVWTSYRFFFHIQYLCVKRSFNFLLWFHIQQLIHSKSEWSTSWWLMGIKIELLGILIEK